MTRWICAVSTDAVPDGEVIAVTVEGMEIALCRAGDRFHAMSNICTHGAARLSDGVFDPDDGTIECPLHAGQFDIVTGAPVSPPVRKPIRIYPVRVEGGQVLIDTTSSSSSPT